MQPFKIDIRMSGGKWQIVMEIPRWLQREFERQQDDGAQWRVTSTWITSGSSDADPAGYSLSLHIPAPSPEPINLPLSVSDTAATMPDPPPPVNYCERNPLGLWQHTWVNDLVLGHVCRHCGKVRDYPHTVILPDNEEGDHD